MKKSQQKKINRKKTEKNRQKKIDRKKIGRKNRQLEIFYSFLKYCIINIFFKK